MASKHDVITTLQTRSPICHWCAGSGKSDDSAAYCTLCRGLGVSPAFQRSLDKLIEEVKLLRGKVSNGSY